MDRELGPRILVLAPTPYYSLRGTPIALRFLLECLSADGHEVEVLTYPMGQDLAIPRVHLSRCGSYLPFRSVPFGPSLRKIVLDAAILVQAFRRLRAANAGRRPRYLAVHAIDELAIVARLFDRWIDCPVVYDMDSSVVEQFAGRRILRIAGPVAAWIERALVTHASAVICVSPSLEERVRAIDPAKPVMVLPDTPARTSEAVPMGVADELFWEGTEFARPLVLYAGNLGTHQGVSELVEAFGLLRAEGHHAALVIAGGSEREIARLSAVGEGVRLMGQVERHRLPRLLRMADVLVSPRLGGSNVPMKIYDYIAARRLILATRIPAHTQLLADDCAILVEPTVGGLLAGLRRALTDSGNERLVSGAGRLAATLMSPEEARMRLKEFYGCLLRPTSSRMATYTEAST